MCYLLIKLDLVPNRQVTKTFVKVTRFDIVLLLKCIIASFKTESVVAICSGQCMWSNFEEASFGFYAAGSC